MALYSQEQMTTLHNASDVKRVAGTALAEIEIMSIASAINHAANNGETQVVWPRSMAVGSIQKLDSEGYKVIYNGQTGYYIISWKE